MCEHFCRLLAHMDAHGYDHLLPAGCPDPCRPGHCWIVTAGYVKRAADQFPHQGIEGPWRTCMDYRADYKTLREGPVEDDNLRFTLPADALEPALTG